MKKIVIILLTIVSLQGFSQGVAPVIHSSQPFPTVAKIKVSGHAIREVVPNQIYFNITLSEDKSSRRFKSIDSLERQLYRLMDQFKIPHERLTMKANHQRIKDKKRGDAEVEITRTFNLLITDKVNLRSLLVAFYENSFYNISISHISHTEKDAFMEGVRSRAMKSAQTKAKQLLAAVDKKPGALLEVIPQGHNSAHFSNIGHVNSSYNSYIASKTFYKNDFNYAKLKLEASYQLIYEIKN
jgi:uncharacterized protein YggE